MHRAVTKFDSIESFETEHLLAKRVYAHDLNKIIVMHKNDLVMQTLGGIRSREESINNLKWNLDLWEQYGFGLWMFYLKSNGTWIGRGGIRHVTVDDHDEIEIGYALMPEFWQQGYGTEIARASVAIAFEVLRLDNLVAFTQTTNYASQNVMKKAGFHYERDFVHANQPHVLYRLLNPHSAVLEPYNPKWPEVYQHVAAQMTNALGNLINDIHHIGSTAIPNMPAKPVIDILLECKDLIAKSALKNHLAQMGFTYLRRNLIPHVSFFSSNNIAGERIHLHLFESGDPQIKRHIHFRDYLISFPNEAKAYADLKLSLSKKYLHDMLNYVKSKQVFVRQIDYKAKRWQQSKLNFVPAIKRRASVDECTLCKTIIANLNCQMTYYAQFILKGDLIRVPGSTSVNTLLPDDTFNYVLDADFVGSNADEKIENIKAYFKETNTPFSWWVSPFEQPEHLPDLLVQHGFTHAENNLGMYFNLAEFPHNFIDTQQHIKTLKIVRARDKKTLLDYARVLANDPASFATYFSWVADVISDDDPIEFYVGYLNEQAVVKVSICFYAGIAGFYCLSTSPEMRHQGFATQMQYHLLKRAKELGYEIAVLSASEEAYPFYEKLGYEPCAEFKEFKLGNKF